MSLGSASPRGETAHIALRARVARALSIAATALTVAAGVATESTLTGCGGPAQSGKTAAVQAGDMPAGAEWSGVYFSELYGYLHIVQDGTTISGKWLRPVKDRWGELHGKAVGDLIRFEWTEHIVGRVGPNATRTGKGYLKYARPAGDNVDDLIKGEIGVGQDEVGELWDAVKQRNMLPDLTSIGGGSGAGDLGGGDWDSENKEPGKAEPPAPPAP